MSQALYELTINALLDRDVPLNARDEWRRPAVRVGREREPALLAELYDVDLITPELLPFVVAEAWSAPEWPSRRLDHGRWLELFRSAEYAVDGEPAARPAAPVRLYRGADAEHRAGMAWTDDRGRARWFAERPIWPARATVWTTLAAPAALLARLTDERSESEYVVDPAMLGEVTAA